jgi:hypothetical protein
MKRPIRLAYLRACGMAGLCLAFGGCAVVERGLDLVLAPAASGNLLSISVSAARGLVQLISGAVVGL